MRSQQRGQFAEACSAIAEDVADATDGFVPIRRLLDRFRAELIFRPLLVEGMFAQLSGNANIDWAVLIDSETHQIAPDAINTENSRNPLPFRLRNTIAHELIHSLAFRAQEFGVQLDRVKGKTATPEEFVKEIERETESLSPLLLLSRKTFDTLCRNSGPVRPSQLRTHCTTYGVSPYVLINRLRALRLGDSYRDSEALNNVAIGLLNMSRDLDFSLLGWPIFENFNKHLAPSFIHEARRRRRLSRKEAFGEVEIQRTDCGHLITELSGKAGTVDRPQLVQCQIRVSIEMPASRTAGPQFFVAEIRRHSSHD